MADLHRQIDLEQKSVTRGVERYFKNLAKKRSSSNNTEWDSAPASKVVQRCLDQMIPAVAQAQRDCRKRLLECYTTGSRVTDVDRVMDLLSPEALAYITIRTVLMCKFHEMTPQSVGYKVGNMANLEVQWSDLRKAEAAAAKAEGRHNRLTMLKRTVKQVNPKSVRKWLKRFDELASETWSHRLKVHLGMALLTTLVDTCPDEFTWVTTTTHRFGKPFRTSEIRLSEGVVQEITALHDEQAALLPWKMPMVCPPKQYRWDQVNRRYTGGYWKIPTDCVIEGVYRHTGRYLKAPVIPEPVLEALNRVQATPWRINTQVLGLLHYAVKNGIGQVLPVEPERELPPQVPVDEWKDLTFQERGKIKTARREVYDHNFKLASKRQQLVRVIDMAKEFADEKQIWFPYQMDFRGRMYPTAQYLTPQGDDPTRGLLTFADGKPLGQSGFQWLLYYMAALYGHDKMSKQERADWVFAHDDQIVDLVYNPWMVLNLEFWSKAEEPWQFMAACIEYVNAMRSGNPHAYVCALPIHVDGSCNGLQHLSAMGRDMVGAKAVNLTAGDRQDVYREVRDKVGKFVVDDCMADHPVAPNWDMRVTRKVVKRAVMTLPYGLTQIGMRDQLIADRKHWDNVPGDVLKNANYMRDKITQAMGNTVGGAMRIMEWLQEMANLHSELGLAIKWHTPLGLQVIQEYNNMRQTTITTLVGTARLPRHNRLQEEDPKLGLNKRRQRLSIAPNVIHSFDAAHAQMVINKAYNHGIKHFSMIHDSFGVHACDMDKFATIIRDAFAEMYETNWFERLADDFDANLRARGASLNRDNAPELGTWEPRMVCDSDWFFA